MTFWNSSSMNLSYRFKKKKKTCMELEFMELEFQNATIGP